MRVKDLPAARPHTWVTGLNGIVAKVWTRQPILYCQTCRGEYSGNPIDYNKISMTPDSILRCCGAEIVLVDKHIVYERVKLELSDRDPSGGNAVCRETDPLQA